VFSPYGGNFLETMLRLAASRNEVSIVADQVGAPTYALDLADAVIHVASQIFQEPRHDFGVFHATGSGYVSWAEFASAIFQESAAIGGPSALVIPITSDEYPTPARRPINSRLSNMRLLESYGIALPQWQDALKRCMARLSPEITRKA
jgi:dTDP-4-dehydrorhamnose reductase